ncbi:MAG TPA: lactate utilization protein [Thermodesulfobacteriota bacterium]|nr:lactate utilization protein [Thermodesulfobacteriota bacterium]
MKFASPEIIARVVESLKKNEMEAVYFSTVAEAKNEVLRRIPLGAKVGIGGSITLREMGIPEVLEKKGHEVYDHWREGLSKEKRQEVGKKHQRADVFLTSTNALTLDGKLINVDATGNRVSSMIFGPEKVVVISGVNKIVRNLSEGLARIKKVAAPRNCQRRKDPTPCAQDLICRNCNTPARLCRVTTIIERRPWGIKDFSVILVGEELGY